MIVYVYQDFDTDYWSENHDKPNRAAPANPIGQLQHFYCVGERSPSRESRGMCQNLDKRKLSFLVSVGKPPATFANLFL
jgi:hypothetical protein